MLLSRISVLLSPCILLSTHVDGHAALIQPKSRQWYAHTEGTNWPDDPTNPEGLPRKEWNQYGYQRGGYVWGPCGRHTTKDDRDYTSNYIDINGNPVPFKAQAVYVEGDEIDIEVKVTANHQGHFEFRVCTDWANPTQVCFDENKLTFVKDLQEDNYPIDDTYPERGYMKPKGSLDGSSYVKHRYRLPMGISGDRVLLQWQWISRLGCTPRGYDLVDWPDDWLDYIGTIWEGSLCDNRYPGVYDSDGNLLPSDGNTPQHYWQCAEVQIQPLGGQQRGVGPNPTSSPTNQPTGQPTASPEGPTTLSPTASPVEVTSGPTASPIEVDLGCCTASPGANQPECHGLSFDTCQGRIDNEGKCAWQSVCSIFHNQDETPEGGGGGCCTEQFDSNQPECYNRSYGDCQNFIINESKCAWLEECPF